MTPSSYMRRFGYAIGLALTLTACGTVSETDGAMPRLSAAHVQPLSLGVGAVQVMAPTQADIPTGFSVNFPDLMKTYAMHRFVGDSVSGQTLRVDVAEARVVFNRTESNNDVTRWMGFDGHDDYTLVARVRLTLLDAAGIDQISHELALQNTLSLPDSLSLNEREARTVRFTEQFMADLDSRITKTLTGRFFVVTPLP